MYCTLYQITHLYRNVRNGFPYENPRRDTGQIEAIKKDANQRDSNVTSHGDNLADMSETCIAMTFGSPDLAIIRPFSSHKKITSINDKITPDNKSTGKRLENKRQYNEIRARHLYRRDIRMAK